MTDDKFHYMSWCGKPFYKCFCNKDGNEIGYEEYNHYDYAASKTYYI